MNKLNKKGLTILETLVAIGVISVVIGGAISLIIKLSDYGASSEVRSLAVNFAQEAVDIVKNVRDNQYCNFFSSSYPNGAPIVTNPRYYQIISGPGTYSIALNPGGVWESKYKLPSEATQKSASGDLRRRISLKAIPGYLSQYNERRLTVEVTWQTKGMPAADTYNLVTDLYKWKY